MLQFIVANYNNYTLAHSGKLVYPCFGVAQLCNPGGGAELSFFKKFKVKNKIARCMVDILSEVGRVRQVMCKSLM